jgi:hypothetical protein
MQTIYLSVKTMIDILLSMQSILRGVRLSIKYVDFCLWPVVLVSELSIFVLLHVVHTLGGRCISRSPAVMIAHVVLDFRSACETMLLA